MSLKKQVVSKVRSMLHMQAATSYTERAVRVPLQALHGVDFQSPELERLGVSAALGLANISFTGLGLLNVFDQPVPQAGDLISGTLRVGEESFPVRIRVAHVSPQVVGAAFVDPPRELAKALYKRMHAEISALKMLQVKPETLRTVDEGQPFWFQGEQACDLYYIAKDEKIVRFQLVVAGYYVEGGDGHPLRCGRLQNPGEWVNPEVLWDDAIGPEQHALLERFLCYIQGLDPGHRAKLVKLLRGEA